MKDKKNYQFVLVLKPELSAKDKKVLLESTEAELAKIGLNVDGKKEMGLMSLAYEIEDFDQAEFFDYNLTSGQDSVDIAELNLFLNREENIIRYLFLKE